MHLHNINTAIIISALTSIAALITAIGTLFTARQNKKQRESSYHPELVFASVSFSGNCIGDGKFNFPTNWVNVREERQGTNLEEKEVVVENPFSDVLHIPLINAGLGVANEITGFWSFPIIEFVQEINQLAKEKLFTFKENGNIQTLSTANHIIIWSTERKIEYDYVLPITSQKDPVILRLPITYITLVSALINLVSKDISEESISVINKIPPLDIYLNYFDIGNVQRNTKTKFLFNIMSFSEKKFDARLQPKCRISKY